jgi:hypothetical protein
MVPVLSTFVVDLVDGEPAGETLHVLVEAVQEEAADVQEELLESGE